MSSRPSAAVCRRLLSSCMVICAAAAAVAAVTAVACQYRCGTAVLTLWKFAKALSCECSSRGDRGFSDSASDSGSECSGNPHHGSPCYPWPRPWRFLFCFFFFGPALRPSSLFTLRRQERRTAEPALHSACPYVFRRRVLLVAAPVRARSSTPIACCHWRCGALLPAGVTVTLTRHVSMLEAMVGYHMQDAFKMHRR